MATQNAINTGYPIVTTGFESWSGGAPYFDDTTLGSFTVSQAGTGYIKEKSISWTAPQTVTGMTAGNSYVIYIDDTGTIGKTTTYSLATFQNYIPLFECMRDSTAAGNNQVTVKENHPYDFSPTVSRWAHEAIGVLIENHVGGANIVLNGTQKIQINGADELSDHGLYTDIPDSGGVGVAFNQYFTLGTGKWARYAQSDTFDGRWNNAGTPTAIGNNKYTASRLYVSKDNINAITPVYFSVLGDAQYNNLVQAQTAVANGTIPSISGELAFLELAQLGYIIFEESSTSIIDVIIEKETLTSSFSTSGTNQASLVLTDTTNFDHILSSADTNVQAALDAIDDHCKWIEVTGASQSMSVNRNYAANNAGLVTLTLPDTAAFGSEIEVIGKGAGGWRVAQNAGESIIWDEINSTTVGVGGSLSSTDDYDYIELICTVADTTWTVASFKGTITII